MNDEVLVYRLRKRAEIRRQITTRKSVQEGKPDRIADLLEEAADALEEQDLELDKTETVAWLGWLCWLATCAVGYLLFAFYFFKH
jgi:hypothetical protein